MVMNLFSCSEISQEVVIQPSVVLKALFKNV